MKVKVIPGFKGYKISRKGKVFNRFGKKLTNRLSKGRARIRIVTIDGKSTFEQVSRLVAITYIPNPNNYPCVLHIDNNPLNNFYKNLRWGTHKMNMEQKAVDGRWKGGKKNRLDREDIESIKSSKLSNGALADFYNVSSSHICGIRKGRYRAIK